MEMWLDFIKLCVHMALLIVANKENMYIYDRKENNKK